MNQKILFRAFTVAALLGAPVLPALAQQAPSHSGLAAMKGASHNVDAHIATLHRELQITPAEETEWNSFAQVMRDNAAQMDAAFEQRGAQLSTMNAVENLQSYAQIAQLQSNNMQKLAAAFQTLYASFPPAQQKLADNVFRAQEKRR